ncbi:MAG: endonuclease/exonuclease/phosphatase family protein [Asticcacaulis sp.]
MLNRIRAFLDGLCILPVLSVLAAGIGVLLIPDTKYGQFLIQILNPAWVISVFIMMVALAGRFRVSLALATLSTVLLSACLYPQWTSSQTIKASERRVTAVKPSEAPFRILFANNWAWNKTPDRISDWIALEQPDVVVLAETDHLDPKTIRHMGRGAFAHTLKYKEFWILSRYPISVAYTRKYGDGHPGGLALWDVDIAYTRYPVRVIAIHTARPWPFTPHGMQDVQQDYAARIIAKRSVRHTVMVGDFNAVTRSSVMQAYARSNALSLNSTTIGTWPTALPGLMRLGIDNALYSEGFKTADRKVGPHTGSDHRPIRLDLYPAL